MIFSSRHRIKLLFLLASIGLLGTLGVYFSSLVSGRTPIQTPYLLPSPDIENILALRDLAYADWKTLGGDRETRLPWQNLWNYASTTFDRLGFPPIDSGEYILDAKCGVIFSFADTRDIGINNFYVDRIHGNCTLK